MAATVCWSNLAKWGLGPRDLKATVNFFSRVNADSDGRVSSDAEPIHSRELLRVACGDDVLAILNICRHPLEPNPKYEPRPVQLAIRTVAAAAAIDSCRTSRA
jgi:uncharacterized protein